MDNLAIDQKERGAFFTPPEIAQFITDWAVRSSNDEILEPSCGEAAFLLPASRRIAHLGPKVAKVGPQLHGLDIHEESIESARTILANEGLKAHLEVGDFFNRIATPSFDAVIGNPPYVRYQNFYGQSRMASLEAAARQGVKLNQLASSWAAFTVHAAAFLKPEGRLGLVLPAELLTVKYASHIRRYLLDRFARVRLVLFENLVFPGVLEDVVLLLAEGSGGASSFEVYQAKNANDLLSLEPSNWVGFTPRGEEKWTSALLPTEAFDLYNKTLDEKTFETLADWGETFLGAVTGNNNYFALNAEQVKKYKIPEKDLIRISPPGSRHLRGLSFTTRSWESLMESGEKCFLFYPGDKPSKQALEFISYGEQTDVHLAYKCKVRTPWWRVPLVSCPDLFLTYMNHDRPRLVKNEARTQFLNSLYGVNLFYGRKEIGKDFLPIATLNSLSLLGSEIVGRAYGGGLLKHEPTEAAMLPMPSLETLKAIKPRLQLLSNQVGGLLRGNNHSSIIDMIDRVVLKDTLHFSDIQIESLRFARETLLQRRMTRARGEIGKS